MTDKKQPAKLDETDLDQVTGGLYSTHAAGTETFTAKNKLTNSPLNLETKFEDE
ncbi:MAG: hypothetical protein KDE15_04070 [Erythrobacter sp.]|nr:hypothetical protein [Erythrobacter sp.]